MRSVSSSAPYQKSMKVKVICWDAPTSYVNEKKEEKELLNVVVGDSTKAVKCVVYDKKKFHRFSAAHTLIIRNVIKKPESFAITSATVVIPTAQMTLPEHIVQEGRNILHPPPAEVVSLERALASPPRTMVSVRGTIMQEEATRLVSVKNEDGVQVKTIHLDDGQKKCKVALWRKLVDQPCRPGDYVVITDVITNTFRNEVSLSTTSRSVITKAECPEETKEVEIVCVSIDEDLATILLSCDKVLTMPVNILSRAFPECDADTLEDHIVDLCADSLRAEITFKGSDAIDLKAV